MDTHSRIKKHQTEAASDNAGPFPETRPDLTGIIWQKESGKRTIRFFLADENATENFGRLLGALAADGDVYCLSGDLGAGKTLKTELVFWCGYNFSEKIDTDFAMGVSAKASF